MFIFFCYRATMSLFSVKCLMEQVREHVNQRLGKGCSAFADDQSEEYEVFLEQLNQSIDDGRFAPAESAEGKTCRIVFSITPLSEDVSVPTSSSSSMPPPPPPLKRKKEVVIVSDDEDDEVVEVEKKKKAITVTSSQSLEPIPSTSKQISSSSSSPTSTAAPGRKRKQTLVPKIEPDDVSVSTSSSSMPPPPPPLKRKKEVVIVSDDEDDEVVEVEKKKKAIIVTSSESAEPMPSTSKQKVAPTCNVTDEELARMMTICEEEWVWDDFLGNHPPKNQKQ